MKKKKLTPAQEQWIAARKRFRLSHAHVQMARELGMSPRSLGGMANHQQERWKAPLPEHIEHLYEKRFGRRTPESVRSIEEGARLAQQKRAARKAKKREAARELALDRAVVSSPVRVEVPLPADAEWLPRAPTPDHRISEALLEVVKPFVRWPPAPSELKPFRVMLEIVVAVWNASLEAGALDELAGELEIGRLSREEVRDFLGEIAARKRELYPDDLRFVAEVHARIDGEQLLVTATCASRPA